MDILHQIYQEALHPVNIVFTLGLMVVIVYWLLVIFGCFGAEGHGDASADGADLHAEADGADAGHDAGGHDSGHDASAAHGSTQMLLRFLNVGDVPIMPLLSIAMLSLWVIALLANHYLNPTLAWGMALMLLAGNLLVTAVVVHFASAPLKVLFRAMNQDAAAPAPIPGSLCKIQTATADESFGEAIIERDGAPLQIHVRTAGETMRQGDRALVVQETDESGIYLVTPFDPATIAKITNPET